MNERKTYVFIDESGDTGFKITQGSSPIFCITAVIFYDEESMAVTENAIKELRKELGLNKSYEFHFNNAPDRIKYAFCNKICSHSFKIRAIVIDKYRIYSDSLMRTSPNHFYNFTTKMLIQHNFGTITNARVKIDGKMNRDLKTYLRKEINKETKIIHSTKFADSNTNDLIQLADMCAGSISRSYKIDKTNCCDFRKIFNPCISNIWEFGNKK